MKSRKAFVSPIAVDLGATHTGVYTAFYKSGSEPKDIERKGVVYHLERNSYTFLMKKRTQERHQRRGFDRRQMAKRLFRLIWEKDFQLDWDAATGQAIGFLLNRRGYSYLSGEYDENILAQFSKNAWEVLPEGFREKVRDYYSSKNAEFPSGKEPVNFNYIVEDWGKELQIADALKEFTVLINKNKENLNFFTASEELKKYCAARIEGEKFEAKVLKSVSPEVCKRLNDANTLEIPIQEKRIDLVSYLEGLEEGKIQVIYNSLPDYKKEIKECNNSVWSFKKNSTEDDFFKIEASEELNNGKEIDSKIIGIYLCHLLIALENLDNEIKSGAMHRKKYLEDLRSILLDNNHKHRYLKEFCQTFKQGRNGTLTSEQLTNLIGHINNLELKPLRKYFNDKKHQGKDYWDSARMEKYFENWILREWRVDLKNNPEKDKGGPGDYKALCKKILEYKGSIVDFWMETDPTLTIPPYQNHNNRRPPRCQSLILNASFLNKNYPDWKNWLKILKENSTEYLGDMEDSLKNLQSAKKNSYFNEKVQSISQGHKGHNLDARIFQFILDRSKKTDPFSLNTIYSITKKLRQQQGLELQEPELTEQKKLKNKLDKLLESENLQPIKKLLDFPQYNMESIFPPETFLHLICRYYKMRQRARDGRIFIHPSYISSEKRGYEKTNTFNDDKQLLTYCNHKSRQKKYQSIVDLANIFQIDAKELRNRVGSSDEDLLQWLGDFRGLKTICADSAKCQKKHRGNLRQLIYLETDKEVKTLNEKAKKMSQMIAKELFPEDFKEKAKKFESIFSFAQIHNIAYTDRSGNSNTCPVCSLDNGKRMETLEGMAKAQRLSAIPTRLIDGAVMRMSRILAKRIVEDRWPTVEGALKEGQMVHIPIITESNSFEFEPSLDKLKEKPGVKANKVPQETEKYKRIKKAGKNICPYTGNEVGDNGQFDHIIPRSSGWGILNDEANLIWASEKGNNKKLEKIYRLENLHVNYKKAIFETADDEKIKNTIMKIWNEENNAFVFGKYNSFINLGAEEQRAFRHALFLDEESPLRKEVLFAISNRTRAFVNGTQRYFAEVLSNEFYKKALGLKCENSLSFDFFGIKAFDPIQENGVKEWRTFYEFLYPEELEEYEKRAKSSQKSYSHLLDAQIAFLLAVDKHRNSGSLQLLIPDDLGAFPFDKKKGELIENNLFKQIWISPDEMEKDVKLERRKPKEGFTQHRPFTRASFYAIRYLPLLMKQNSEGKVLIKKGFSWKNSCEITKKKDKEEIHKLLPFFKQRKEYQDKNLQGVKTVQDIYELLKGIEFFKIQEEKSGYICLAIDRKVLHEHGFSHQELSTDKACESIFTLCYKTLGLGYQIQKISLTSKDDLDSVLAKHKNFKIDSITLPFKKDWEKCQKAWEESKKEADEFLREYFIKEKSHNEHQKVRKVFSLPIKKEDGKYLLRKNSWDGNDTFQVVADSDSRLVGNKARMSVRGSDGSLGKRKNSWVKSKNLIIILDKEDAKGDFIDSNMWFLIDMKKLSSDCDSFKDYIEKIWIRIDDVSRPSLALKLKKDVEDELFSEILNHTFFKPKETEVVKKEIKEKKKGDIIIYKAAGYNKICKEAFKTAVADELQ